VNLAGIAAHLAGGAVLLAGNKGRLATQHGVASATVAKAAVTGLALGATAYSRALGERLIQAGDAPVEGGTTPTDDTPPELASAQRQLTVLRWVIPRADRDGAGAERPHGRTAAPPADNQRAAAGAAQPAARTGLGRYRPPGAGAQPTRAHHLRRGTDPGGQPLSRRWRCNQMVELASGG
jgi:hypothetical protein